ncbi:MAG: hypothetical protein WC998_07775, partial [Candidatus Paceibacterota bacterium]
GKVELAVARASLTSTNAEISAKNKLAQIEAKRQAAAATFAAKTASVTASQNNAAALKQLQLEQVQRDKLALLNTKKLNDLDKIRAKEEQHAKARKKELTEEEKAIKTLQGSSNGMLSHFEKGIIVANQLAELMRKIQQFTELMMKPIMGAGQFEQWQVALKNLTGSAEIADAKFREMIQFAKTTPFTIPGIMETGMRLEALGRYSLKTIRMLGDLAAASGKDVTQAVEAYSNLVTGRTGIAVKQFRALMIATSDWTRVTGKAVLQNMKGEKATVTEMLTGLEEIVKQKNFSGLMDAQSKTLLGKLSNLQDSIQTFLAKLGENFLSSSKDIVSGLTDIFNSFSMQAGNLSEGIKAGGLVLVSGAVLTLAGVIVRSGAAIIAFFKALSTVGLATGLAAMPVTSIAAIVVALAGLTAGIWYYISGLTNTNKEMLEFKENLKSQKLAEKEAEESTVALAKSHIAVIESYKKLRKEYEATGKETKAFKKASDEVASIMPGLAEKYNIVSTGAKSFDDVLIILNKEVNDSVTGLDKLQNELNDINLEVAKYKFLSFVDTIKDNFDT